MLAAARPRGPAGSAAGVAWLASVAGVAALAGLASGGLRLAAIDAGATDLAAGARVELRGFVTAVPRRADGLVRLAVDTSAGRLLVEAREPVGELAVGSAVRARGTVRDPGAHERAYLERLGIADVLAATAIDPVPGARAGLQGELDAVRARAERALGDGTAPASAALLRGFVLGQDDRIDPAVVDEFKASGLAHLLAVSGQNVVLLAILAAAVLGGLGVSIRMRLLWIIGLIAVYVPVAGAGASIQRAGVMGAAGVVATLAGRPRARWYALLLAAAITLALDPRATADVGWQLSFAAVAGILLWSRPIAGTIGGERGGLRAAVAQAIALTLAATIATAPLMAHHFGTVSLVSLAANLVALPAVAPVMWLGMLAAAAGQLEPLPVEPLSALAGLLAAYIAQVAGWFATPTFALAEVELESPAALAGAYAALGSALALALAWSARRRRLAPAGAPRRRLVPAALALLALIALATVPTGRSSAPAVDSALRLTALDVGQGDAILLEPRGSAPILVDTGPAAADVAAILAERGIDRLAALVITHPESDHDGGAAAVLERIETERLLFARARPATVALGRARGARPRRLAAGDRVRAGELRLDVLWPPAQRLGHGDAGDANLLALVLHARSRGFDALLAADAEAEAAPVDPGPVELLKVAHHGSEDAGLGALLERTDPRLALVSAGADNPYGHPAPATLAELAEHGVGVVRTDLDGEIAVEVDDDGGWAVR